MFYNFVVGDFMDLTDLLTNLKDKIEIDCEYVIPNSYKHKDIKDLDKVKVVGKIERKTDGEIYIDIKASGRMLILDSISLDDVWYPFSFETCEKLGENSEILENRLEIVSFLWQNIVLEVPLRYTTVENYEQFKGDGWMLVSEEDVKVNTPFSILKNLEDRSDK